MSRCLRYQNPVIYEHLAGQYVAGVMSSRVRARTEVLMQSTPELERAIAQLADSFSQIPSRFQHVEASSARFDNIWTAIDKQTAELIPAKSSFWDSLILWKAATGVSAFASLVLAVNIFFAQPLVQTINSGPSYLANMSATNDTESNIQFVISAYSKKEGTPSRLHVQWSQTHAGKKQHPPLHLWAEDKDTQQLTYIGLQPAKGSNWNLMKPSWKAIANSSRLFMTADSQQPNKANTIFSGICLQLKQWKS